MRSENDGQNVESYFCIDSRLQKVSALAEELYLKGQDKVHNFAHALWDTSTGINIINNEVGYDVTLFIPAGLMHDTGITKGPYNKHMENGGILVRKHLPGLGFNQAEVEEIATAVKEHNGDEHTTNTSRILYDADTLNKAGVHGINEWLLYWSQFPTSAEKAAEESISYLDKLEKKGFYTETATRMNQEAGFDEVSGLVLTLKFWEEIGNLIKLEELTDSEALQRAKQSLGIENVL
ncbi:HD domain-containing protein [Candidatus Woesearchaeota archaeon]|nr:HD domain-containing protein [Candidatus Woesearchaeota archaeon]